MTELQVLAESMAIKLANLEIQVAQLLVQNKQLQAELDAANSTE